MKKIYHDVFIDYNAFPAITRFIDILDFLENASEDDIEYDSANKLYFIPYKGLFIVKANSKRHLERMLDNKYEIMVKIKRLYPNVLL